MKYTISCLLNSSRNILNCKAIFLLLVDCDIYIIVKPKNKNAVNIISLPPCSGCALRCDVESIQHNKVSVKHKNGGGVIERCYH